MDKQQLLEEVKSLAAAGQLSRSELAGAFDAGNNIAISENPHLSLNLANVLYYIGGGIVFIGIAILVGQNWEYLNDFTKILSTLGSAVAAYIVGAIFYRYPKLVQVATAFFFLSALLMPLGIAITFDLSEFLISNPLLAQTVLVGICLAVYLASYFVYRTNLFHIFNIIFGTWFFYAVTDLIVGPNPVFDWDDFFYYRSLVAGLSLMFLGYYFSNNSSKLLAGILYVVGPFMFLGSALALQGYMPEQNAFWEIIYPGLVFGVMFLSVYLQSKSFFTLGALFLMAYIIKITGEYFSEGLGWPTSLVFAGMALIVVGYMTVWLKGKYFVKN
jgi:hypothetical protein